MQFENDVKDYLSGSSFSNGLNIKICKKSDFLGDRLSIIENISNNKDIIHLGCVDHIPLIEDKIRDNTWLHSRLCSCTRRCLGIDNNCDGIEYLASKLGYTDVICADIINSDIPEIINNKWDYLIMGEILEHVDDPCSFLRAIRNKYSKNINSIIISVPNALSWQNITHTFSHEECINSDHRYWFTPYTLAKVITLAGMEVAEFFFCQPYPSKRETISIFNHPFSKFVIRRYPATRQTLVMVVKL